MRGITRLGALFPGILVVAACSTGGDASGPPPPPPPTPVATVTVTPAQVTVEIGATAQLSAETRAANGTVLTGRSITWSSSNPSLATVDQNGLVRGVAAGTVSITATSEGRSGSASAEVRTPAIATIEIGPNPGAVFVGTTLQLTPTARAANGTVLTGKTFTWNTSNAGIAQVSTTGLVTGVAQGSATISAVAEGVTGNATINVTPAPPITITQVTPATLVEGQAATITGTGFNPTANANTVTIDGVAATVTQATATTLQITVPRFACRPRRTGPVEVAIGQTRSNVVQHAISPASFINLAVGGHAVIQNPADLCLQFDAAATAQRYVFGVQSVTDVAATLTAVTVTAGVPAGAPATPPLPPPSLHVPGPELTRPSPADLEQSARWLQHLAVTVEAYERERIMLEGLRRANPLMAMATGSAGPPTVPGSVMENDLLTVRFPQLGNSCAGFTNIQVRVRKISPRGIFVEDTGNPVIMDQSVFDQAATDFGTYYDADVDLFGAPTDMDGNQRIVIVVTKEVNKATNPPLGFVAQANLFPTTQCVASNEGEFFWMRAADPTGQFTAGVYTLETLRRDFHVLLIHEFAHIIQGSRRLTAGGQFMSPWLAEALAIAAQEIVGFQLTGLENGMNYGRTRAYTSLGADPRNFFGYSSDLLVYFGFDFGPSGGSRIPQAPHECSWVGRSDDRPNLGPCVPAFVSRIIYNVPWSLIRYIIDRHLGGPAAQKNFLRAFSDYAGSSGFPEVSGVLGRPMASMMAEWAPMLYIDDRFPAITDFQYRNWNLRDIAAAWNSPNADLAPMMRGFSAFTDNFNVRGGSSAYFDISGATRPATAIRARDGSGNPLPPIMQLWIVRVQ